MDYSGFDLHDLPKLAGTSPPCADVQVRQADRIRPVLNKQSGAFIADLGSRNEMVEIDAD